MNRQWKIQVALITLIVTAAGTSTSASKPQEPEGETIVVTTYWVSDLPVWHKEGGKFDPTFLIAAIKQNVAPASWGPEKRISSFAPTASLIVSQTTENQEAIQKYLEDFREKQ
jgi:hypothetical protein